MALTSEQKLRYIKNKFCGKIDEVETLDDMLAFVANITPANIKVFLKIRLQEDADLKRTQSAKLNDKADELEDLKNSL